MKVAHSPIYTYEHLPAGHRFPMEKYELLPKQLLLEGTCTEEDFFRPSLLTEEEILRTHDITYWNKLKSGQLSAKEIRATGFPFHPVLVERGRYIAKGTLECAFHAMTEGVALNIAGGTHHSFRERGEGFCLFNDIAIASTELLHFQKVEQILIVDLDVHQGNGTASIFKDEPRVFTFSMHGGHNYPLNKERSDLDIPLRDGTKDDEYIDILAENLPRLIKEIVPDLIFYLSGVDVLATDKLGRLAMSIEGCKERDRFVFDVAQANSIPIAVSMGGGYSTHIKDIIEAHANTFRMAKLVFS